MLKRRGEKEEEKEESIVSIFVNAYKYKPRILAPSVKISCHIIKVNVMFVFDLKRIKNDS
jgi:hypothetical protein